MQLLQSKETLLFLPSFIDENCFVKYKNIIICHDKKVDINFLNKPEANINLFIINDTIAIKKKLNETEGTTLYIELKIKGSKGKKKLFYSISETSKNAYHNPVFSSIFIGRLLCSSSVYLNNEKGKFYFFGELYGCY